LSRSNVGAPSTPGGDVRCHIGRRIPIWAIAGAGFFWRIFPMLGFAVALAAQARKVFGSGISEAPIDREVRRERGRDSE
jgi:hypothetical protein